MRKLQISTAQTIFLLFVCRMFTVVTFSPIYLRQSESNAILLGDLIAAAVTFVLLIPLFCYFRGNQRDFLLDSMRVSNVFGKIVVVYFFLVILLTLIATVSHLEYFITNAVFPNASSAVILVTFLLACMYGAWMGLEGVARSAGIVFVFFVLSIGVILCTAWSKLDWIHIKPLVDEPVRSVMNVVLCNVSNNMEFVVLMMLLPHSKGSFAKISIWYLVLTSVFTLLIKGMTILILGDYTMKQIFPFYTLASIAETKVIPRLDSLHMALWILVSFIRTSLYLIAAQNLLQKLLPKKMKKTALWMIALAVFLVNLFLAYSIDGVSIVYRCMETAIPLLVAIVLLPLILLLFRRWKRT